jgi:hypothetical protein
MSSFSRLLHRKLKLVEQHVLGAHFMERADHATNRIGTNRANALSP